MTESVANVIVIVVVIG